MKKLSEYRDEEALDLLADLLEPTALILGDSAIRDAREKGMTKVKLVSIAIKNHKKEVMEILALMNGVPIEEYHCNMLTLPVNLLELLNDKDIADFFKSQGQMMENGSSTSATEDTKEEEV